MNPDARGSAGPMPEPRECPDCGCLIPDPVAPCARCAVVTPAPSVAPGDALRPDGTQDVEEEFVARLGVAFRRYAECFGKPPHGTPRQMAAMAELGLLTHVRTLLAAARAEERERCIAAAERCFPKAHTYASENADLYRAQDDALRVIVAAIRAKPNPLDRSRTP